MRVYKKERLQYKCRTLNKNGELSSKVNFWKTPEIFFQIRIQALVCLGKLLPNLEAWMVTEQVLPTLPKINSKEPGVLMAILGNYVNF